ncbi:MAG: VOC family protein [Planctomycetota bacterium]|jgi:catechol 2,3-dioxygenase-like lactoylglutathione lyase family enzyme
MKSDFGSAAPIFRVQDVRASLDYYRSILGFESDWDAGGMVSVSRDDCTIFLTEWDQGQRGTWAWIGVKDCAALHEELAGRGARVRHRPTNYPWALEMQIEDLDGNVLRLGSEPRDDVPFGQFLDAKGVLWDTEGGRATGTDAARRETP